MNPFVVKKAYHWEIGREATADDADAVAVLLAYHWEIGREATAFQARGAVKAPRA
jgi:hypothetical protein